MRLDTREITNIIPPVPEGEKRPLWSVMIPTFNPTKFLLEAIESVVSQYPDSENMQIEIVDDCSTIVDVGKLVSELGNDRINFYRQPKNLGHSRIFTDCLKRAKGKLIHLLHQDDKIAPDFYQTFENIFENYTDIGAAYCRQKYVNEKGEVITFSNPDREETGILEDALILLAEKQRIQYCGIVVKREVYENLGGFIPSNIGCEDWEMWVRIAAHYPIVYEPRALAIYRMHSLSMSSRNMRTGKDMKDLQLALDIFNEYLPEEKRKEVKLFSRKHYAQYSFRNAKRLLTELNDEEGASAQLSETIKLNSELIYSNLNFISEFKTPVESAGVSVLVFANNDPELIEETISKLVNQKVPKYIPWEIILVNDNLTEETVQSAARTWNKYKGKTPFRILEADPKNIFNARKKAVENAKYNFIIFCNPGNLLSENYVRYVSENMMKDMNLGAIGAYTDFISKVTPPKWFNDWSNHFYKIGVQHEYSDELTWTRGYVWGSGMALRKDAWQSIFKKKFETVFGDADDELLKTGLDSELCYALRLSGWTIRYSIDLKLDQFISESEFRWRVLRKKWKQEGINSVFLEPYLNFSKHEIDDYTKLPQKINYRQSIKRKYRKLRSFKKWKLNSYTQSLENDYDILKIEFILGRLKMLLNKAGSYNKRIRLLRKISRKKDFSFLKYTVTKPYFRFPQYKKKNDRRGVSVILNHRSSYHLLFKSLEKISEQKLPESFLWEVILVSSFIEDDIKEKIYKLWQKSKCRASLKIVEGVTINPISIREVAVEKSKYNYLIFLNENNFIYPDYVRIAFKVIHKNKKAGILGGQTELASDVNPPKWFYSYKEFYGIGTQSEEAGDITLQRGHLWNAGIVARKDALKEISKSEYQIALDETSESNLILPDSIDLSNKIKLAGWRIIYEPRLKLKNFITVNQFNWNYLRKLSNLKGAESLREEAYSKLLNVHSETSNGSEKEKSWIYQVNKTFKELRKYPVKKIFSHDNEFRGDNEIITIEQLRGRFNEILKVKGKFKDIAGEVKSKLNGNGFTDLRITGNGSFKSTGKTNGVSIVICCYNSSEVIEQTLKYIISQKVPDNIPWEVIIVDNASTDDTSKTSQTYWDNHNCLAPFKIVRESEPGLSAARRKGFDTAKYEFVLFCDDDNRLGKDFVRLVYEIMNSNSDVGILGGQSLAEYDLLTPGWFDMWKNSFAIGKQSDKTGDVTWSRGYVWGAAMIVRKEAWKKLLSGGFESTLTDRKGNTLSAGGDTEICYALRNQGWKIWYDSRLKFKHYITEERLNWDYLKKLFRGFGQASSGLDRYVKESAKKFGKVNKSKIPGSERAELYKTLLILRNPVYKDLMRNKKFLNSKSLEGNSNIPMVEYCLGRIESLIKSKKNYNSGLKLLKRVARKAELKLLSSVLKDNNGKFPRYKTIKKLNGVSVIICTFNGADRLRETIKHIAKQKTDPRLLWELILVDNASTDNTKQVTSDEWSKYKTRARLKIVDEPTQGLSPARQKGFDTASYEYIVLCDDDNWLEENFVQSSYDIMSGNDKIGVLGGPNDALCELPPAEWFRWFQQCYAAGTQADIHNGKISEGNITWKRGFVWGAGMVVRKTALKELYSKGFKSLMSDRKGYQLSSGGDSELCYALVLSGWQVWYDNRLKLKHCMPAGRLSWNYLIRLFQGFGITSVGLDYYEKAIKLSRLDRDEEKVLEKDWWHEVKRSLSELRKIGLRKLIALRNPQDNNTSVPMTEYHIYRLKELLKVRKEYNKNLESVRNAVWKKSFKELKGEHRKYIETENDFRYGWPWVSGSGNLISDRASEKQLPKISILSPSFNSENTIEKAILSVLNQGYTNIEHIICDGGSKDRTLEIIKKYPHIKYVSEPDKGQCDAMNKAFAMSTGDIIVYLNVDDYFQRGAFAKIVKAFEQNPEAEMVVGNLFFEYEDHTFIRKPEIEYEKIMLPFKYIFPINPVSYFYKRNVQEKIGPFPLDNHFTMDYWFLLKAYQKHKIVKIEDYLGTFWMNGLNKTSGADNRKNTHAIVVEHLKLNDKKNLSYYLYNYYKFFYYESKPYNLKTIQYKIRKNLRRVYSILKGKKNKYYSDSLYQKARSNYYMKKRFKSSMVLLSSFLIHPKGIKQRSRQSLLVYSFLGQKKSEKAKLAYNFLTTPPGLPLANKLYYFGNEFRKTSKPVKGRALLLLTYIISPKFIFKKEKTQEPEEISGRKHLNPLNSAKSFVNYFRYKKYKETSYGFFEKAGNKYYYHKNFQATLYMMLSIISYPLSVRKKSRMNMLVYSALGDTMRDKIKFVYHLYYDNPENTFAHKLNYYGNELREERQTLKGNAILFFTYLISPKYITKRKKIQKSKIVYVSEYMEPKKRISLNPLNWGKGISRTFRKFRNGEYNIASRIRYFFEMAVFRIKSVYYYFRYRKFKAQSKDLYARAQDHYRNNKRLNALMLMIPSFILYPLSLFNRNKWGLVINCILGNTLMNKIKGILFR